MSDVIPKATDVATLMKDMLGRGVTAKESKVPLAVNGTWKGVVTEFMTPEGALGSLLVVDLPFACHSGAALTLVPPAAASDSVKGGSISEALLENYYEVANILTALYRPYGRRLIRGRLFTKAGDLPPNVKNILAGHSKHLYVDVDMQGYGAGRMALLNQ